MIGLAVEFRQLAAPVLAALSDDLSQALHDRCRYAFAPMLGHEVHDMCIGETVW
jgi:hypothetical protein